MEEPWKAALESLTHPSPQVRLRALRELIRQARAEDWQVWQRIEWLALYDRDPMVRQIALSALLTPEGQRYYELWLPTLTITTFSAREAELQRLKEQGQVDAAAAEVILDFYRQYAPRPPEKKEEAAVETVAIPRPPAEAAEGAGPRWHIVTYVGAFLLAVASLLLTGIPELRLPVLWGATVLFFAGSVILARQFRTAAALFYSLATFYLWADAFVLVRDGLGLQGVRPVYWAMLGTTVLALALWAIGTAWFRSLWFALLTASALPLGAVWLTLLLEVTPESRPVWGLALVEWALAVQWVWLFPLRHWDKALVFPARILNGVLSTLVALGTAGLGMFLLALREETAYTALHLPFYLTWVALALFFLLALFIWPIPIWDGLGMGWTLFWGVLMPAALIWPEGDMLAPRLAGIGLLWMLFALMLALLQARPWLEALLWALVGSGTLLSLAAAGITPMQTRASVVFFLLATALVQAGVAWRRKRLLMAFLAAGTTMIAYYTYVPQLQIQWPTVEDILWHALALAFMTVGAVVTGWRIGPRWAWAWVVPGLLPAVIVFDMWRDNLPQPVWPPLLLALVFALWLLATRFVFWFLPAFGSLLLVHWVALPERYRMYWPVTYLPYPLLLLAVEQLLASYPGVAVQAFRKVMRWAMWLTLALLGLAAFSVQNWSVTVFVLSAVLLYAASVAFHRTPWPAVPAGVFLVSGVGDILERANISSAATAFWIGVTAGVAGLAVFWTFRRFGRPYWAAVWALLSQLFMYTTAFAFWMEESRTFGRFLGNFAVALGALLFGIALRSGVWIWPALVVLLISVVTVTIRMFGTLGVVLVVAGTGLLLLLGGLYVLFRRRERPS